MKERVIIVGAGQAGGRSALALRQKGFRGEILLIGAENEVPYERPPLSKGILLGSRTFGECELAKKDQWNHTGITRIPARTVTKVDILNHKVTLDDSSQYGWTKLILATGARPRQLSQNLWGEEYGQSVSLLRTIGDALSLKEKLATIDHLCILGGGFIGLEVAASARILGKKVSLIEAAPHILNRALPETIAKTIQNLHENHGVVFRTSALAEKISRDDSDALTLHFADRKSITADHLLVGIGIIANTHLAEACGLKVSDGIETDAYCRTSHPDILAVGDCACCFIPRYDRHIRLESWQNAEMQASIAAGILMGESHPYDPVPWLWSEHYDWTFQLAGFFDPQAEIVQRGHMSDGKCLFFALENDRLQGVIGLGRENAAAKEVRIAQMLIEKNISVSASTFSQDTQNLKSLLKA